MYWLTPFKYLLEGMLALVTHDQPVQCAQSEFAKFRPPPGQSCQSYAGAYTKEAGGYVTTLSDGLCGFCQYASGDQFAASFNVYYKVSCLWVSSNRGTDLFSRMSGEITAFSGHSAYSRLRWYSSALGCISREAGRLRAL